MRHLYYDIAFVFRIFRLLSRFTRFCTSHAQFQKMVPLQFPR